MTPKLSASISSPLVTSRVRRSTAGLGISAALLLASACASELGSQGGGGPSSDWVDASVGGSQSDAGLSPSADADLNPNGDAPPPVTGSPGVGLSQSCGGQGAITLTDGTTQNGCNIAPGAASSCPANVPQGDALDAFWLACFYDQGRPECALDTLGLAECPFGQLQGPVNADIRPPEGQAGYGSRASFVRSVEGTSLKISYTAQEFGVNSDGSVAWEGPVKSGVSSVGNNACCSMVYNINYPGSGRTQRVQALLHWFE